MWLNLYSPALGMCVKGAVVENSGQLSLVWKRFAGRAEDLHVYAFSSSYKQPGLLKGDCEYF